MVWFTTCGAAVASLDGNAGGLLSRPQERSRPERLAAEIEQPDRSERQATSDRRVDALTHLSAQRSLQRAGTAAHAAPPNRGFHSRAGTDLLLWTGGRFLQPPAQTGIAGSRQLHEPAQQHGYGGSMPILLLGGYCVLIVLASLFGGWLPSLIKLTHDRMQFMISLVGGLMLGIGIFHMLPHAVAEMGSLDLAVKWMMAGLLTMFFLIRMFHFHQHEPPEVAGPFPNGSGLKGRSPAAASRPAGQAAIQADGHHHDRDHGDEPGHAVHADDQDEHGKAHSHTHQHRLSWIGVMLGLSLHTLIDGLALAASVEADAGHGAIWSLFGFGTFVAICLHKPLDAVSITSLMTAGHWSVEWRHAVNAGFAMMCPLGVTLFYYGLAQFTHQQHIIVGCALAFAAGVFLCISLGDLLPEMEFHSHNRVRLTAALLIGIAAAYAIGYLEPEHGHSHGARVHTLDHVTPESAEGQPR